MCGVVCLSAQQIARVGAACALVGDGERLRTPDRCRDRAAGPLQPCEWAAGRRTPSSAPVTQTTTARRQGAGGRAH